MELQIWRQIASNENTIDYTRVYNEMVIVTDSTTSTNIFTITPTVATTYESGDIVGFYLPTQGASGRVEIPFATAGDHSYYSVANYSPSDTERITVNQQVVYTKAPFLESKSYIY